MDSKSVSVCCTTGNKVRVTKQDHKAWFFTLLVAGRQTEIDISEHSLVLVIACCISNLDILLLCSHPAVCLILWLALFVVQLQCSC